MTGDTVLLNEEAARRYIEHLGDPVVQNLVLVGLSHVKMRVTRHAGQGDQEWRAQLPSEPIDLEFLARSLASMFSSSEVVRALLDGKSIAEASGWDL